jgi:hypothetical protein
VRIEWRDVDRYNRTLGHIYIDDRWINKELVAEGMAWHYKHFNQDARLEDAEVKARQAKLGLWADPNPVPPWEFRHGNTPQTSAKPPPAKVKAPSEKSETTVYITRTGEKYHLGHCRYLSKSKIPISLEEAKGRYGPCSDCKPPR